MSTRPDQPWMLIWRRAIADEIRARMARKRIDETFLAREMGVTQSYLNRRRNGIVPFTVEEALMICDLMDEDFAAVVAAAKAAATTNPCLSHGERLVAERELSGWARRGYELARLYYGLRSQVDSYARSA